MPDEWREAGMLEGLELTQYEVHPFPIQSLPQQPGLRMSDLAEAEGEPTPITSAAARDYATIGLDLIWAAGLARKWLFTAADPCDPPVHRTTTFGINVASSEDVRCDDYIIDKLKTANIKHVRLTWAAGTAAEFTERFLGRLLAADFEVMVALIPDPEDARRMAFDAICQQRWRLMVQDFLQRYANRVAVVEIGNAPNRPKWSGYSPRSYISAWRIAAAEANARNVKLAGPNINDFEPFFNVSYLRGMRRIGPVPAVQTDNLFVERAIEPEANDPSALGRLLAPVARLNLIKKINILANISATFDIAETYCTYACWTHPRLARWTAFPEKKACDYLARYLILGVASGSIDRIYWGPLIDARDGLINCGSTDYPFVDNVAHYARIRGEYDNFCVHPSFRTFEYVTGLLSRTECRRAIVTGNGFCHFIYTDQEYEYHVAYGRDRLAFDLNSLYAQGLDRTTVYNANGEVLAPQQHQWVAKEAPLILRWPNEQAPQTNKSQIHRLDPIGDAKVIHGLNEMYFPVDWHRADWRGAVSLPLTADRTAAGRLAPESLTTMEAVEELRDKRNRLWTIASPVEDEQIVVKLSRTTGGRRLSYLFRQSKGKRHWNNATEMLRLGINTPRPIAFFEQTSLSALRHNYYLCKYIEGAFSVRDVFTAFMHGEQMYRNIERSTWIEHIAQFVANMHRIGIVHRDLSSGNIMITLTGKTPEFFLIDIGRAIMHRRSGFHTDLRRICYKLNWPDRELFIAAYAQSFPKAGLKLWRLSLRSYDAKQRLKKRVKKLKI